MARLNFYINRAGDNLSNDDKARLESAKEKLSAAYDDAGSLQPNTAEIAVIDTDVALDAVTDSDIDKYAMYLSSLGKSYIALKNAPDNSGNGLISTKQEYDRIIDILAKLTK